MYQKDLVRRAWREAGLYRTRDPKLRAFLKFFDAAPANCWPQVTQELRERYAEYTEQLVTPIWNTGDKLLRLNLIRAADAEREEERTVLLKLMRRIKPELEALELHAVVDKGHAELLQHAGRKRGLPQALKLVIDQRLAEQA